MKPSFRRAVLLGVALTLLPAPVLVSPAPAAPGADAVQAADAAARRALLDSLTVEIVQGVMELRQHYIIGGDHPLPVPVLFDFLSLRALGLGRPDIREEALALAAAYTAADLNGYLAHGIELPARAFQDSTARGRTVEDEAALLTVLVHAYRGSGKEMFRRAAIRTGEDLLGWAIDGHSRVRDWIRVEPDTAMGSFAGEATSRLVAALGEGGLVLNQPRWLLAVAAVTGPPAPDVHDMVAFTPEPWDWETFVEAGLYSGANPDPAALEVRLKRSFGDARAAPWVALAALRTAALRHDDDLAAAALAAVDGLGLKADTSTHDHGMEDFAARTAAAMVLELSVNPAPTAYIIGGKGDPETQALIRAAASADRPGRLLSVHAPADTDLLYPAADDGKPIAYVCSGELCAPPVRTADDLRKLLESFALPEATGKLRDGPPAPGGR